MESKVRIVETFHPQILREYHYCQEDLGIYFHIYL